MAFKSHEVKKYNYSFDARAGGPGGIQIWGSAGVVATVYFVDDASPIPAPTLAADLNTCTAYFRRNALPGLIDMLRNESPVYVTINNQPPGFVFVKTGLEPAGEGEG